MAGEKREHLAWQTRAMGLRRLTDRRLYATAVTQRHTAGSRDGFERQNHHCGNVILPL